ncbi:MAG: hydantoinase/oxoprolinase family protein [Chloroflexaceae bacterium]|nr:hydantoinase/oxoprolinase family protein [Chloroflexaceae bacterium]
MRIATDIGGTFTDLIALDTAGNLAVTKTSTTPANFARGVLDAIGKARVIPEQTSFFVHGSTVIINTITERKGVKTALITTQGFRDVLEIGRANRPDIYNTAYQKPVPFIPRALRFEVRERMTYKGAVYRPLDEGDMARVAEQCRRAGVEAIAVCFLHAYMNPAHELRCGDLLRDLLPDIPVTLSHQITAEWREYERTSTAALNSYVLPIVQRYLNTLEQNLGAMGMPSVYHIMQSNGGSATFAAARTAPIRLVESGPVAGVIGTALIGQMLGEPNLISLDIGGTTAKCSLIERGELKITTQYKLEHTREFAGYPVLAPTVDIVEIGAGGGSIAWIDAAGSLRIGPESAGADPGPACYGTGTRPTVTDAKLVAGVINPDYFLGGEISVNLERARTALEPIASHFAISIEQAAMGVIRLADAAMINALKLVSVRSGYDPRDFSLVAFGGGGSMHAAALGRDLHVKQIIIPRYPGLFSAWGMLMADLRQDFLRTQIIRTDQADPSGLSALFEEMEAQAVAYMQAEHLDPAAVVLQRYADIRYIGQEHTVKVAIPAGPLDAAALADVNERFHAAHERSYTFRLDTTPEIVNFHLIALGHVDKPQLQRISAEGRSIEQAHKGRRSVNFDELGYYESDIYERDLLPPGATLRGPLVVEEPSATTLVFPDQQLTVDQYGLLYIRSAA